MQILCIEIEQTIEYQILIQMLICEDNPYILPLFFINLHPSRNVCTLLSNKICETKDVDSNAYRNEYLNCLTTESALVRL